MDLRKKTSKTVLFFLAFSLTACGGGGGSSSVGTTVSTGTFVDGVVGGLSYVSGDEAGETNAAGEFYYETGKTVTFTIGDIVIGTATGSATVTPLQIFSGATDENNLFVMNMVRFLMTIDDDHNPSNGIQITQAIRDAAIGMTIDFTLGSFETDSNVTSVVDTLTTASTVGNQVLVSESAARTHFGDTLRSLLSGSYTGTYSGDDSGIWSMTIASDGTITGSGNGNAGVPITITGSVATSGMFASSGWTGKFDITTGKVSGSWTIVTNVGTFTGTYSGSKN